MGGGAGVWGGMVIGVFMVDSVDLAKRAFALLGSVGFRSVKDGSHEAALASVLYDGIRDAFLSQHIWNFATKRARLVAAADFVPLDYAYGYVLPSDFLRAIKLVSEAGDSLSYRIVHGHVETDHRDVWLFYIARVDEADFPPFFQEAFVARLAADLCLPLTENSSRARLLMTRATLLLREAKTLDSQQDSPEGFEDFSLLTVRG